MSAPIKSIEEFEQNVLPKLTNKLISSKFNSNNLYGTLNPYDSNCLVCLIGSMRAVGFEVNECDIDVRQMEAGFEGWDSEQARKGGDSEMEVGGPFYDLGVEIANKYASNSPNKVK